MNFLLLEHSTHGVVAANHSTIIGILEIMGSNISPYSFDSLWPGKLVGISIHGEEIERHGE